MIEKGMRLNSAEHTAIFGPVVLATALGPHRIRAFNDSTKKLMENNIQTALTEAAKLC